MWFLYEFNHCNIFSYRKIVTLNLGFPCFSFTSLFVNFFSNILIYRIYHPIYSTLHNIKMKRTLECGNEPSKSLKYDNIGHGQHHKYGNTNESNQSKSADLQKNGPVPDQSRSPQSNLQIKCQRNDHRSTSTVIHGQTSATHPGSEFHHDQSSLPLATQNQIQLQKLLKTFSVHPLSYFDKKFPFFRQPKEIGSFSQDFKRNFKDDSSQLSLYCPPLHGECVAYDLRKGYDTYIKRDESVKEYIDDLLRWISQHKDVFSLRDEKLAAKNKTK